MPRFLVCFSNCFPRICTVNSFPDAIICIWEWWISGCPQLLLPSSLTHLRLRLRLAALCRCCSGLRSLRTVSNRSQMKMERPPCLTQNGVDACGQTVEMLCRRTFMLLVNLQDRFACFAIGSRKCKMVKECVFFPLLFRKTNGRSCPSSWETSMQNSLPVCAETLSAMCEELCANRKKSCCCGLFAERSLHLMKNEAWSFRRMKWPVNREYHGNQFKPLGHDSDTLTADTPCTFLPVARIWLVKLWVPCVSLGVRFFWASQWPFSTHVTSFLQSLFRSEFHTGNVQWKNPSDMIDIPLGANDLRVAPSLRVLVSTENFTRRVSAILPESVGNSKSTVLCEVSSRLTLHP